MVTLAGNIKLMIMKITPLLLVAITFFIAKTSSAQIDMPVDSVQHVLCQKWEFKAVLMGGQRLTNMNESVNYQFKQDRSFTRVSSKGKEEKGSWVFNLEQKVVLLKIKKVSLHIPLLSKDELVIAPGDGSGSASNALGVGTILQPSL